MSSVQAPLTTNPNMNQPSFDGGGLTTNAANPGTAQQRPNSSYFPYPQHNMPVQDQTLSNTLANTHIASPAPVHNFQIPGRQPKFNEEWDASVRGGSIVDGPSTTHHPYQHQHQQQHQQQQRLQSQSPNLARANSTSSRSEIMASDSASVHGISLSRGNTLKKKNSLRRSASLKRSSSRRSMKAGSVRSLALQSSHEPDEIHSAFHCPVPTSGAPTEILAQRFQGMSVSSPPSRILVYPVLTPMSYLSLAEDSKGPHRVF